MLLRKNPLALACALAVSAPVAALAAPTVSFKAPVSGQTISGNIYQSSACEAIGTNIDRVRFYLDGTLLNTEENSPWLCNLDTRNFSNGTHTLQAVAYDSAGASASRSISVNVQNGTTTSSNTPPAVSFSRPLSGATVSGSVSCLVSATDSDGIRQLQWFLDGTLLNTEGGSPFDTCNLDSRKFADGAHTLKAVATDNKGATGEASVSITIRNSTTTTTNALPTVSFSSPASGATLSGTAASYAATAADSDGSIAKVDFYVDSTLVATRTAAPYSGTIDTTKFANGAHTLQAVATDNRGATRTAQLSVNVSNTTASTSTLPVPGTGTTEIWFKSPVNGATVSGLLQQSTCYVNGRGVSRVEWFLDSTALNIDSIMSDGMSCVLDTTKFANGTHALKAVAYGSSGSYTETISINVQNAATANVAPTVGISSPASGATLAGSAAAYSATAADSDGSVARVEIYVDSTLVATKTAAPYSGTIDTTKFANGAHTLRAVATDNKGAQTAAQVAVNVSNQATSGTGGTGGTTSSIDSGDILTRATADSSFSSQSGYTAQAINTYTSANQIPESGINGSTLPNGETLRLGKVSDPTNSVAKALSFQVINSDPTTSGGKRAELSVNPNIDMGKVYWAAFSAYVYDWGTLGSSDAALFGIQLHSGNNSIDLSPAFGLYTTNSGRNFKVQALYSTSSSPSQSNTVKSNYADQPIPFGQWVDFVFKFRQSTSGSGYLQVWMNGTQIVNHQGNLGFNTGSTDYMKFGYYNWSGTSMGSGARKVLLRSPTIVADPTGSKYSADQVRALVSSGSSLASTSTTTTASSTGSGGGVCSTASCVIAQ